MYELYEIGIEKSSLFKPIMTDFELSFKIDIKLGSFGK